MKPNTRKVVLAVVAVLCVVFVLTAYAQTQKTPQHTKWEYRDSANIQIEEMNKFGEEGWDLVEVVTYGQDQLYIFKRPK